MSACSPKEELEWRSRLTDHSCKDPVDAGEQAILTILALPVKSMGTVFGKPGKQVLYDAKFDLTNQGKVPWLDVSRYTGQPQ
jgi:hypothetical protein